MKASDQTAEAGDKPRGNDEGSGNQEEKKKEERPQLNIVKVSKYNWLQEQHVAKIAVFRPQLVS